MLLSIVAQLAKDLARRGQVAEAERLKLFGAVSGVADGGLKGVLIGDKAEESGELEEKTEECLKV